MSCQSTIQHKRPHDIIGMSVLRNTKLHCHTHFNVCNVHLCNLKVWLIMWGCSVNVEAVLLATSVSFLCPAMLNPSRNSDRNKTSTCYVCMHVCTHVRTYERTYVCTYVCMYVSMDVCVYICMYACMYALKSPE